MAEIKNVKKVSEPEVSNEAKTKAKADKFKALAAKRVAKSMQSIRLIGNLASPNYLYTDEQINKIIAALQTEVDTVYEAFKAKKSKDKITFDL